MKKFLIISAVVIVIAVVAFFIYKSLKNNSGANGGANGTGNGHGVNTGGGIYPTSTTPLPPAPKTLNDFIGQRIVAKYDGTKLYNNDLTLADTYNKGDYIGWLGGEAKGYLCCKNQSNFYKVYDNANTTGLCGCEPIMSDEALKSIFGI